MPFFEVLQKKSFPESVHQLPSWAARYRHRPEESSSGADGRVPVRDGLVHRPPPRPAAGTSWELRRPTDVYAPPLEAAFSFRLPGSLPLAGRYARQAAIIVSKPVSSGIRNRTVQRTSTRDRFSPAAVASEPRLHPSRRSRRRQMISMTDR